MTITRGDGPEQTRLLSVAPLVLIVAISLGPSFITVLGPAPPGHPLEVGARALARSGHACDRIIAAERLPDETIRMSCADGESYRISAAVGWPIVLKCSIARQTGFLPC